VPVLSLVVQYRPARPGVVGPGINHAATALDSDTARTITTSVVRRMFETPTKSVHGIGGNPKVDESARKSVWRQTDTYELRRNAPQNSGLRPPKAARVLLSREA